ncbi:hypothetical protein [Streptomyces sp. NPDC005283]|uniref:hypothetical protein n=1 Tax=Streptomyces sp. NPDC005283 TaxID=3156871 RepID=UPI003456D0DD
MARREEVRQRARLKAVRCANSPDGQVVANHQPVSLDDAERNGNAVCGKLLKETVRRMAEARAYALLPSSEWDSGVRSMPCLVYSKTVPIAGAPRSRRR